eukprot:Plantae.Rhodophyta-Hildenbrandia_rubra.ctg16221.p1 GENE.Plantae.Rhodophyta-Hildenbrandia_rubra.ctg16221~~Plantae.Rhodophyta-Hildenbrandia_rubra.ctg16221.p1  ORF type:complete len:557 (+),score=105.24 Plantae.Rhodophyta-Hildenbrandia_rubra.ctg16221:257-1927(+)
MAEIQIIDHNGNFVGGLQTANDNDRDYAVVAVVGCQSGGKSTLLNAAFGTKFPVLDAPKSGRRRTTLGVWAAVTNPRKGHRTLVVLDVEGTDSRERGEGAKGFEAATTLLALGLGDAVVVNMWAHDVGRYTAAGYELFETVFAQAGRLRKEGKMFGEGKKVRIIVVVRDHDGESRLQDIRRVVMGDLEEIWDGLKMHGINFGSLFQFEFVLLPHKIYRPEKFTEDVEALGEDFSSKRSGYFSGRNTVPTKALPISGFDSLVDSVWTTLKESGEGNGKDSFALDLPKHAELVARFKCAEVVFKILEEDLRDVIDGLRGDIEASWRKPSTNFGTKVSECAQDAFKLYRTRAAAYREVGDVYEQKRTKLSVLLAEKLSEIRERHLLVCREFCMNAFDEDFRPLLGGTAEYDPTSRRLAEKYVNQYKALVNASQLPPELEKHTREHYQEDGASDTSLLAERGSEYDDSDDDSARLAVDQFRKDVNRMVEDRRRLGELMLPQGSEGGINLGFERRGPPWWKGVLIRGGILLLNYLQATQGQRQAMRAQRQYEEDFPPGPSF